MCKGGRECVCQRQVVCVYVVESSLYMSVPGYVFTPVFVCYWLILVCVCANVRLSVCMWLSLVCICLVPGYV